MPHVKPRCRVGFTPHLRYGVAHRTAPYRGVGLRYPAPHVKPRCRVGLGYVAAHHAEFYGILELAAWI
nr:hypothetical protein [uncultured Campylobacter sp.]